MSEWQAPVDILIGDRPEVVLTILGREFPTATNVDDANWLDARVRVVGETFAGTVSMTLTAGDLPQLRDDVAAYLRGDVSAVAYLALEEQLELSLEGERGDSILRCVVRDRPGAAKSFGEDLALAFDVGRGFLERLVAALSECVRVYPPVGRPPGPA